MASPGGREVGRISIRVVPDTSAFQLDLKTELAAIEARNKLHIATELDTSGLAAHAKAAVAEVQALTPNVHIKTEIDSSGLQGAERSINGLVLAAVALAPALIPLAAGVVAIMGPVVAIFGAAAAGAGAFGAVLIPQLKEIIAARKAHALAEKAYNAATTDPARAKALADEQAALAGLTPAQLAASSALDSLSATFTKFTDALAPTVLPVFTQGLDLLARALPGLTPFVTAASTAFSGLLTQIGAFGSSSAGKSLVDFFARQVGPAITTLGTVFLNVFAGIGGILKGFGPLIGPIEQALTRATASFAAFGASASSNAGFQAFIGYLQKTGPQVIAFLDAFIGAAVKLVQGLAPLGGVILVGVTALLNVFAGLPTGVVTGLAVAIGLVVAAVVASNAVLAISNGLVAVKTALEVIAAGASKAFAAGQWLLNAALSANPIGLVIIAIAALVAGLILAYKHSETFRNIVNAVWTTVRDFVVGAATAVKDAVVTAFQTVRDRVSALVSGTRDVIVAVWQTIRDTVSSAAGAVSSAVTTAFHVVRDVVSTALNAVDAVVSAVWGGIRAFIGAQVTAIVTIVHGVSAVVGIIRDAFGNARDAASEKVSALVDLITGLPGRITSAVGNLGRILYEKGQSIIQGLIDGITSKISAIGDAIGAVTGKIAGFLPGSPVKEGPLRVLNGGRAGGLISQMVADGITGNLGSVNRAMGGLQAPSGGSGVGAGGGHSITINAAPNVPTETQLLSALGQAEAL